MSLSRTTYYCMLCTLCICALHAGEKRRLPAAEEPEPGSPGWVARQQQEGWPTVQLQGRTTAQNLDEGYEDVPLDEEKRGGQKTGPSKRGTGSSCLGCKKCPAPQRSAAAPAIPCWARLWAWCTRRNG